MSLLLRWLICLEYETLSAWDMASTIDQVRLLGLQELDPLDATAALALKA